MYFYFAFTPLVGTTDKNLFFGPSAMLHNNVSKKAEIRQMNLALERDSHILTDQPEEETSANMQLY